MADNQKNHWDEYHRAWSQVTAPLRPNGECIAAIRREIAGIDGRALLLGVTPEYADLHAPLFAIARNIPFLKAVWPGNSPARFAVAGDWLLPNFTGNAFALVLGDGSFTTVHFPGEAEHLRIGIQRVLRPGGRLASRLFLMPDTPEKAADVIDSALAGATRNFHAFKLRLAMALAAQKAQPNIRLADFYEFLSTALPDRDELVRRTGWPREQIDTIDHYKGSQGYYNFPTREQFLSVFSPGFSGIRFVQSGNYELAERCPLIVMERN